MEQKLLKLVTDKHGKVVIWQRPNLPLIGLISSLILSFLPAFSDYLLQLQVITLCFASIWGYLELTSGRTQLRRIIGACALAITCYAIMKL